LRKHWEFPWLEGAQSAILETVAVLQNVRWRTDGRRAPNHDQSMVEDSKASQYRALAEECERLAAEVSAEKQRDELLRKAKGYRMLAENDEWLNGNTPSERKKLS
jgi:hypothetical protein